jgi:hypothetical protein
MRSRLDLREQNLRLELRNDRAQSVRGRSDRDLATTEGKPWDNNPLELRAAMEQSDLIRIQVDQQLRDSFPTLSRTQLDELADQLDSRLRHAKSNQEVLQTLARLMDLQNYIAALKGTPQPSHDLFVRNIRARLIILNTDTQ